MSIERYNAAEAEARWQKVWDERGIFATPAKDAPRQFSSNFRTSPIKSTLDRRRQYFHTNYRPCFRTNSISMPII